MKSPWKPYTIEEADVVALWVPRQLSPGFAKFLVEQGQSFDYDPVAFGQSAQAPAHLFAFSRTPERELRHLVADFHAAISAGPLPARGPSQASPAAKLEGQRDDPERTF